MDLTAGEWEALDALRPGYAAARAIRAALDPAGLLVRQHNGVAGFQTVGHVHVHVTPEVPGPFPPAEPVPRLPLEERLELADTLRRRWPDAR